MLEKIYPKSISNSNKTLTSFTKFDPPLETFVNLKNIKIFNIYDFSSKECTHCVQTGTYIATAQQQF